MGDIPPIGSTPPLRRPTESLRVTESKQDSAVVKPLVDIHPSAESAANITDGARRMIAAVAKLEAIAGDSGQQFP
jgi:hypothetical protein